jgi:hypothetical protein
MKNKLSLLVGFASLAAIVGVQAQSAVTDPVGYVTSTVAGTGSPSAPSFSAISPTLVNKIEFAGAATTVATVTITFTGTPFTAGAYTPAPGTEAQFYAEAPNGEWRTIASNTANQLVLETAFSGAVVATNTIKVRRHVTLSDYFGATNSAGLLAGGEAAAADEVIFLDSATQSQSSYFYSNLAGFTGWKSVGFDDANNKVIPPNQGLIIARKTAAPVSIVRTGYVKTGPTQLAFNNGFNVVPVPHATGTVLGDNDPVTPLADSNLFTGSLATGVQGGGEAAAADEFIVVGGTTNYFYSNLAGFTGWKDVGFGDASTVRFPEGSAVLLNRKGGGPFVWTAPAQVIAN